MPNMMLRHHSPQHLNRKHHNHSAYAGNGYEASEKVALVGAIHLRANHHRQ
jgi:hypothetical protein